MLMYCEKCAYIGKEKDPKKAVCHACETKLLPVPEEYLTPSGFMFVSPKAKEILEDKIKQGPNYDSDAYDNRDEIILAKEEKRKEEVQSMINDYNNASFKVTCPICKSHNVTKISNVGKVVKVGAFGILGAGDIGKTYKCKACGYRF